MADVRKVPTILKVVDLCKRFGDVVAIDHINFELRRGEIHCLLGENGAGKSTLAECLYGAYKPDSGKIFVKDKQVAFASPKNAIQMAIGMVHQHFVLVPPLSVVENIVVGTKIPGLLLNLKQAGEQIRNLCEEYGASIDVNAKISQLSLMEQQWVEILKALYLGVDILILDEPTTVLTPQQADDLFITLRKMTHDGLSIIFITHKLHEVMNVSDRITVLRKGKVVTTSKTTNTTIQDLAQMMVGREVSYQMEKEKGLSGNVIFKVEGLHAKNDGGHEALSGIDFQIRRKEILGLSGVGGNGQRELFDVIVGVRKTTEGSVWLDNLEITNKSPDERFDMGLASIPQDKIQQGLLMESSVGDNLILGLHRKLPISRSSILKISEIKNFANQAINDYKIDASGPSQRLSTLSGGNLQKVILARELTGDIKFVIAHSPTRGLDVGATDEVHKRLVDLLEAEAGILLISEDLDEIFKIADRIAVIFKGKIVGTFDADKVSREEIGLLMAGVQERTL